MMLKLPVLKALKVTTLFIVMLLQFSTFTIEKQVTIRSHQEHILNIKNHINLLQNHHSGAKTFN